MSIRVEFWPQDAEEGAVGELVVECVSPRRIVIYSEAGSVSSYYLSRDEAVALAQELLSRVCEGAPA